MHTNHLVSRDYSIPRLGGPWYTGDAWAVHLSDVCLRPHERFLYEYD